MVKNATTRSRLRGTMPAMLIAVLLLSLTPYPAFAAETQPLITSCSALKSAIQSARDGDTLYVGDIDFTPPGNAANSLMRVEINRNLTVKSGINGKKAVFTNGSFILSGGKAHHDKTAVCFEDIVFDGAVDTAALTAADFELPWDEAQQRYLLTEPRTAQYAVSCKGNVDAVFEGCDFQHYMHEYGPVMHIRYGDYTTTPSLLEMFGDYSSCTLNLRFDHCRISGNAAGYDGGAVYIEGNDNVTFTANDCDFTDNRSGGSEYCMGGGAVYVFGAELALTRCRVENNTAGFIYPGTALPETDIVRGGGLYINNAGLIMKDGIVASNTASMGGGIALTNAEADIDGCVFTRNRAETDVVSACGDTGPWTNMAQGGAVYHEGNNGAKTVIVNSSIYANSAKTAYGGIYSYFNEAYEETEVSYLDLRLCSYIDNTCDAKYDYTDAKRLPWCTHPGDIWTIPYVTTSGCVIIDDGLTDDFPRHELPTAENRYTYFAAPEQAKADGVRVACPAQSVRLSVEAPKTIDLRLPAEFTAKLLDGRYGKAAKGLHAGSNYNAALYAEKPQIGSTARFIAAGCAAVLIAGVSAALHFRRKKRHGEAAPSSPVSAAPDNPMPPERQIVRAWFTDEEIDKILKTFPKAQTLTGREQEVLREILEGKKQKEIAYDLGIEITTVKDFYRKIYGKLDLANKDDLFRKLSELYSR